MRLRRLRKECDARLAGLAIPRPFDVDALCAEVARLRGRPLHLHELPAADTAPLPCGVWIATDRADHIFHIAGSSRLHRDHIVLHEIGHMLFDHATAEPSDVDTAAGGELMPDLDPAMIRRVLRRGGYSTAQEQAAEMIATLVLQRAARPAHPIVAGLGDTLGAAPATRLARALG